MPIDVRMPDGTLITAVPDNITQADLLARYNAFSAQPATSVAPEIQVKPQAPQVGPEGAPIPSILQTQEPPVPEQTILQKLVGVEPTRGPQGPGARELASDVYAAAKQFPEQLASSVIQAYQGKDIEAIADQDAISNKIINDARKTAEANMAIKGAEDTYTDFLGAKIKRSDIRNLPQNLSFSLAAMGSALLSGLGTTAVTRNPMAGYGAGAAAAGKVAYNIDTNNFLRDFREGLNQASIEQRGIPITNEEFVKIAQSPEMQTKAKDFNLDVRGKGAVDELATIHGLHEAGWEAISSTVGLGAGKYIFKEALKGKILKPVAAFTGELGLELAGETATQLGQSNVERKAGMHEDAERSWSSAEDWKKSYKEVAGPTLLTTAVLGGAPAAVGAAKRAITKATQPPAPQERVEPEVTPPVAPAEAPATPPPIEPVTVPTKIDTSHDTQAMLDELSGKDIEYVPEEEVTPTEVPKETISNAKQLTKALGGENASQLMSTDRFNPTYNYTTKDGVEVTFKEDGKIFDLVPGDESTQVGSDVHLDYIGSTERGKGLASKELDRIIKKADDNNLSLSLEVDQQEKNGLTNDQLKDWYARKGFIFPRGSDLGYRPRPSEDLGGYPEKTIQVPSSKIQDIGQQINSDLMGRTFSDEETFYAQFKDGNLKEGYQVVPTAPSPKGYDEIYYYDGKNKPVRISDVYARYDSQNNKTVVERLTGAKQEPTGVITEEDKEFTPVGGRLINKADADKLARESAIALQQNLATQEAERDKQIRREIREEKFKVPPTQTLSARLVELKGIAKTEKGDMLGETGKVEGYDHVFRDNGGDLLTMVKDGLLDDYLPPDIRTSATPPDGLYDARPGYNYISDLMKTGEKVHHYDYEMAKLQHENMVYEKNLAKQYMEPNEAAQAAAAEIQGKEYMNVEIPTPKVTEQELLAQFSAQAQEYISEMPIFESAKETKSFKIEMNKLRRAIKKGMVNEADVIPAIDQIYESTQKDYVPLERKRGAEIIKEKLLAAKRRKELSPEAVDMALFLIDKNPDLVRDLAISVIASKRDGRAGGYAPLARLATIFKYTPNNETAVHEILHHLERMMPKDIQAAIRKAWARSLKVSAERAFGGTNETLKQYYRDVIDYHTNGDEKAEKRAMSLLAANKVGYDHYQNFNPSEFWAINGSSIVQNRYNADISESMVERIKNWLSEFVEKVKALFNLQSDAAVIRALNSVAKGDGKFITDMIHEGALALDISTPIKHEFSMDDIPKKSNEKFTIPAGTELFHGSHKEAADEILKNGAILKSNTFIKSNGGALDEGGLIWFADKENAKDWAMSRNDPMHVSFYEKKYGKRLPGKVFVTVTNKPLRIVGKDYKLSEKDAIKLNRALGLPEYKRLYKGDSLDLAATRANNHTRSNIERFRTSVGEFSSPWPVILKELGLDGMYHETGIALSLNDVHASKVLEATEQNLANIERKSDKDVPAGLHPYVWDKFKKMLAAEAKASNYNYGSAKRETTMSAKRYLQSLDKYYPNEDPLKIDQKYQYEYGKLTDPEYIEKYGQYAFPELYAADQAKQKEYSNIEKPSNKPQAFIDSMFAKYPQNPYKPTEFGMTFGEGEDMKVAFFDLKPSKTDPSNAVNVNFFYTFPQREGIGTKAMKQLQDDAAAAGVDLELFPKQHGAVSGKALEKFYNKLGFNREKGRAFVWKAPIKEYANIQRPPRNFRGQEVLPQWHGPEESKTDLWIYRLQNKQIDTKRVQELIGDIEENWNVYDKEQLYHGRTAAGIRNFLLKELLPIIKEIERLKISPEDVRTYLHNRHAEERNIQMNKINPDIYDETTGRTIPNPLKDKGSGISTPDARAYLAGLDPARKQILEQIATKFDQMVKGTQQILIDSGNESAETIAKWNKTYKHYVPLFRVEDEMARPSGMGGTGQGFGTRGNFSKRAMGSEKDVQDILSNIIAQRERALIRAEKTRVGRALYGLAIQNPNPEFWLPINPDAIKSKKQAIAELRRMGIPDAEDVVNNLMKEPKERYLKKINVAEGAVEPDEDFDFDSGLPVNESKEVVASKINVMARYKDFVFPVRINGKDRYIFFNKNDPRALRMVQSLKNLDVENLGWAVGIAGKFTRWFKNVNTQYNPVFGLVNFVRDFSGALLNLTNTEIKGEQAKVIAGAYKAMGGILNVHRAERKGKPLPTGPWAKLYQEARAEGFQTGYRDSLIRNQEEMQIIEHTLEQFKDSNTKKAFYAVIGGLTDFNDMMENAIRLSAYKVAIDKGLSKQKAAIIAKNLTVNFDKKGAWTAQVNALYAFFNASVQGTERIYRTITGPKGKMIIGGGILAGMVQAMMLAAAGYGDDDPPEFVREKNFIIPLPDGTYLTVPYPLGYNVLPNSGRIIMDFMLHGGRDPGKHSVAFLSSIVNSFNPLGSTSLSFQTLAPTIADPLVALGENKDAFGRPISRKDRATAPTPGYTRSRETASRISQGLAYFLNLASGGSKYQKGYISPTADELDFIAGQVGGGLYREVTKAGKAISAVVTGEEIPTYQRPILGRFAGKTGSQAAVSQTFYDNVTRMTDHENEIKGRMKNRENVESYLSDYPEARLWKRANSVENKINELNKRKRLFLERGFPKERIQAVDTQKTMLMQRFNDQVKNLRPD